jgi:predicted nucleic acid-binding protein
VKLALDTNVLSRLVRPHKHPDAQTWFAAMLASGLHELIVPEIADFELRRELIRIESRNSLAELDAMGRLLTYAPITTADMRRAAALWAMARKTGKPTAPMDALDGDVIVAAQSLERGATVVTDNVKDLSRYVPAMRWQDIAV